MNINAPQKEMYYHPQNMTMNAKNARSNSVNQHSKQCPRWSWNSFWPSLCPTLLLLPTICTLYSTAQCYTVHCTVIRQSIVPLRWASVPLRWAQQRVKRSSHPQKVPMMIKVNEMTMTLISRPSLFWGGCILLGCVKADDDNDGVTLKDYEVEESGEYADCYHKTT